MYNRLWNGSAEVAPGNEILSKASTTVNQRSRFALFMHNEDGTQNRTEKFSFLSNGNFGIGTIVPSYALDVVGTGNFSQNLLVNGTGVSVSGHTHISSNITDFNSSVSGLLPVKNIIAGSGISVSVSSGNYTINTNIIDCGVIGSGYIPPSLATINSYVYENETVYNWN
jgi:hypothetical protein